MDGSTLRTLSREIVDPQHWRWGWREKASLLMYPNGSVIRATGLDDSSRLLSSRFGLILVDQAEQITLEDFNLLVTRAGQPRMPYQQIVLVCNPDSDAHWIYKKFRPDLGNREIFDEQGNLTAEVVLSGEDDNLEYATPEYRQGLDSLDGVWLLRYRKGIWAGSEGLVYSCLRPDLSFIDRPAAWSAWGGYPPPDWARYRAFDFGFQNPFVCQWWAQSPEGQWFRYREIYRTGVITEDHAKHIVQLEAEELNALRAAADPEQAQQLRSYLDELYLVDSISDHDPDVRGTLARYGVRTRPANKEILPGIETVTGLLRNGEHGPQLFFVRKALVETDIELARKKAPTCTEEEYSGYRWQKDRTSAAAVGPRDLPVKESDHGQDAVRYLFHTLATSPRAKVYA